jgi:NitT/TauT family transport system permease protein
MKRLLSPANLLFLLIAATLLVLPARRSGAEGNQLLALVVAVECLYLLFLFTVRDRIRAQTAGDLTAILYAVLFAWEMATTRLDLLDPMLYPTPNRIMKLMAGDALELAKGLFSSLRLLLAGYIAALAAAIPLALVIGWHKRLHSAVSPITRVLGPIPPIVYIPYAIAIFPTFMMSSMFIIFIGAFWPVFINTLNGVFTVDRRIIDSARALNVGERTMLFRVILPASLPSIIAGANIGLVLSFILLTAAEMIGATSGLGWYVKYFSDFADYGRVIVGIIFIGFVVTGIIFCLDRLENRLLRWRG